MPDAATDIAAADNAAEAELLREDRGRVAELTLNRPARFNALSEGLLDALQTNLDAIAQDDAIDVVILGAAGKAFCAGHDLKEMRAPPGRQGPDRDYYTELFNRCSRMMQTIVNLPQPVIARVHGIATAAGCQLVATCDLAVAADTAVFATNGINNGLFCSTPSVALSRNVSQKQAFEMLFTGDFQSAETAKELGLINRIAPEAELEAATRDLADQIAAKSSVTTRSGKAMFYKQLAMDLPAAYDFAADNMACDMMSEDACEGIDAFLQKRDAVWKNK